MFNYLRIKAFRKAVLENVKYDHNGKCLTDDAWSGFAMVTLEGSTELLSASLKTQCVHVDPASIRSFYENQNIPGYKFYSLSFVFAIFGEPKPENFIIRAQVQYVEDYCDNM